MVSHFGGQHGGFLLVVMVDQSIDRKLTFYGEVLFAFISTFNTYSERSKPIYAKNAVFSAVLGRAQTKRYFGV